MDQFELGFPSEKIELLASLKGRTLVGMSAIIWNTDQIEKVMEYSNINKSDFFHLGSSAVVLNFSNNIAIGVCSAHENLAVSVWLERSIDNMVKPNSIFFHKDVLMVVSANNSMFAKDRFADVLENSILRVKYYKRDFKSARSKLRKCEPAIGLELRSGQELIFGQGLLTNGTEFEILFKDEIPSDILSEITEIIIA